MDTQSSHKRKLYLDILRIFSIILVLFNHTEAFHYPFQHEPSDASVYGALFISICVKTAVPLFFMISGALLLTKDESIYFLFKHRVLRFIIIIAIYQIFQHTYSYYICNSPTDLLHFFSHCLTGHICGAGNWAIWFLYAYLAFLLMLPFLRILTKQMTQTHFFYLFVIQLLFIAFIPFKDTGCSQYLFLCNNVFLYALAGYFADHRINLNNHFVRYKEILIAASIVCILLGCGMCEVHRIISGAENIGQDALCFHGCLLIPCMTIFLLVKYSMRHIRSTKWEHLLSVLGGAVFTIMLIENMLRNASEYYLRQYMPYSYMRDVFVAILAFIVGLPIGIILKKIPGIRKLF